jgi:hypothetical protein
VPWNSIIEGADEDNWRMAAWHIFLPIAKALRQRVEDHTVSFSVVVGDMHQHARTLVAAGATPFDAIYLSNVPDYTGVHSALVELRKLLRHGPTNFIAHNNLYNTSMWLQVELFLRSSTRVRDVDDIDRFLGLTFCKGKGDMLLWRHVDHEKLAPEGKLRLWLEELYFSIVSPPYGVADGMISFCERLSLNMAMFFETISALLDRGYAPHLLSSILGPLLVGSATAKTSVALPTESPYPFPKPKPKQCVTDLSMFALDARAVGAIWAAQNELYSNVYLHALGEVPYAPAIRATVHISSRIGFVATREKLMMLHMGVVFLRSEEDHTSSSGSDTFGLMSMMRGVSDNKKLMRHPGSALFSVNEWDIETQTATFFVPANAVNALREQHEVVGVYRSDTHQILGTVQPVAKVVFHTD